MDGSAAGGSDSPEQVALRQAVRSFLEAELPMSRVREVAGGDPGWDREAWQRAAVELGLPGLPVAEAHGGQGASFAEVGLVLGEMGRVLAPLPYLPTVLAAAVLELVRTDAADEVRELILNGGPAALAVAEEGRQWHPARPDTRATAEGRLYGTKRVVADLPAAAVLLVTASEADRAGLYAVWPGDGVTCRRRPGLDLTRTLGDVELAGAPGVLLGGPEMVSHAMDLLYAGVAAECAGAARRALKKTVEHLGTRVQFGRVLGSFQALRHRAADLAVAVEVAAAAAGYAAQVAAGGPSSELSVVAPVAKAACTEAFRRVAEEMIQLHGGIGFTWEHDAHLFLKRAKAAELLHGTPRELRELAFSRAHAGAGPVSAAR